MSRFDLVAEIQRRLKAYLDADGEKGFHILSVIDSHLDDLFLMEIECREARRQLLVKTPEEVAA